MLSGGTGAVCWRVFCSFLAGPKMRSCLEPIYVKFWSHFGVQNSTKVNIQLSPKMDSFWGPLGKLPGAVFDGFGRPKVQDVGSQNGDPKGGDSKQALFKKNKGNIPLVYNYVK